MKKAIVKVTQSNIYLSVFKDGSLSIIDVIKNDREALPKMTYALLPMELDEMVVVFPIDVVDRITDTSVISLDRVGDSFLVVKKSDLAAIDEVAKKCEIKSVVKTTMKSVYDSVVGKESMLLIDDSGTGYVTTIAYSGVALECKEVTPSKLTEILNKLSDKHNILNAVYIRKRFRDILPIIEDFTEDHYEVFGDLVLANSLDLGEKEFDDKETFDKLVRGKKSKEKIEKLVKKSSVQEEVTEETGDSDEEVDNEEKEAKGNLIYRAMFGLSLVSLVGAIMLNVFVGSTKGEVKTYDETAMGLMSSQLTRYTDPTYSNESLGSLVGELRSLDDLNLITSVDYRWGLYQVTASSVDTESITAFIMKVQENFTFFNQPTIDTIVEDNGVEETIVKFTLFQ